MKTSFQYLAVFFFCILTSYAFAQEEDEAPRKINLPATTESWNGLYLKFRLTEKLFYYQENHYRRRSSLENRGDFVGRMSQSYNRFALTYLVHPNFEVTLGPTLVWNFTPEPGNDAFEVATIEPRIWHQWLLNHSLGRVKVLHQFRFEHRWKRDNKVGAEYDYTDRWRYKLYFYIPLNKPRMEDKTLFLSPSNEFFFETGKSKLNIFEENRVYTAIGYTLGNWQFFGGHMWTYGPTSVMGTYRHRHVIRLNVMLQLDLRKNKLIPRLFD